MGSKERDCLPLVLAGKCFSGSYTAICVDSDGLIIFDFISDFVTFSSDEWVKRITFAEGRFSDFISLFAYFVPMLAGA